MREASLQRLYAICAPRDPREAAVPLRARGQLGDGRGAVRAGRLAGTADGAHRYTPVQTHGICCVESEPHASGRLGLLLMVVAGRC